MESNFPRQLQGVWSRADNLYVFLASTLITCKTLNVCSDNLIPGKEPQPILICRHILAVKPRGDFIR
jgi:hypothetical protein